MAHMNRLQAIAVLASVTLSMTLEAANTLPRLHSSTDGRFILTADGKPFFYLADTAWELFHRLNRQDAAEYLRVRAQQGYTAIQAVALAELNGITDPNAYGKLPLIDRDSA